MNNITSENSSQAIRKPPNLLDQWNGYPAFLSFPQALEALTEKSRCVPLRQRRMSTGSEVFSLFICLDGNKFVLLSFFTLTEATYN